MGGRDAKEAEFREEFDIAATAAYILRNGFLRVALQFPDELLKSSVAVTFALKKEISKQRESSTQEEQSSTPIRLFVTADTTFGSCCADEIAAMHVDAQCIVHYGHACLSVSSRLPVWFVFGRATINAENCAKHIVKFATSEKQTLLVLFGLKYIHAVPSIQEKVFASQEKDSDIIFASVPSQLMEPSVSGDKSEEGCGVAKQISRSPEHTVDTSCGPGKLDNELYDKNRPSCCSRRDGEIAREEVTAVGVSECTGNGAKYKVGGLEWVIPRDKDMADFTILWIGGEDPGLTNISLIFNSSTIVRYDTLEDKIVTDVANQSRLLQRRYYLVERAKDANMVGIVVGTLGVAGYGEAIRGIRRMIEAAGKKAYTLVMGKPNPSKLANFPECEVFVLVACPQTALLESKEYFAPVITPFEAELAFLEGKQWTGMYNLDFASEQASESIAEQAQPSSDVEPRFSFFTGSYVGKDQSKHQDVGDDASSRAVVLSHASERALQQLQSESSLSIINTERSVLDIKSGAQYLASRTYQGLDINQEGPEGPKKASRAVVGRAGRAAAYRDETSNS